MPTPVPETARAPAPGQVLGGKYRVVRTIGEGGMGVVLEAEHLLSAKRVAIKWLHPKLAKEPHAEERFVREARAAARVRHPNVVDVYDVVQEPGCVFLVMELLEGEPLSAVLERGTLPMPELIGMLIDAMRGVSTAHKQGVVHRDIKPDNIFLARITDRATPCPKVLDFGISKLIEKDNLKITETGMALGTPLYMSYEQLQGERDVDARTDIYAFAVILYEALTGQPPFYAETFSQLLLKIATQTPLPPKSLRAEVPSELDRAVQRALAKDRTQRTPSLALLISELEPFASESAFRAMMTAQHAQMPAIRPPSRPAGGARVPSASGFRPASTPSPEAQKLRSSSDDALARMRPRPSALWLALALPVLLALAAYYALRGPPVQPSVKTAVPPATIVPGRPAATAVRPTAIATAPALNAAPAQPPRASSTPAAQASKPVHVQAAHAHASRPPLPAAPHAQQPAVPAAEPKPDNPTHLRAGTPRRQDF